MTIYLFAASCKVVPAEKFCEDVLQRSLAEKSFKEESYKDVLTVRCSVSPLTPIREGVKLAINTIE